MQSVDLSNDILKINSSFQDLKLNIRHVIYIKLAKISYFDDKILTGLILSLILIIVSFFYENFIFVLVGLLLMFLLLLIVFSMQVLEILSLTLILKHVNKEIVLYLDKNKAEYIYDKIFNQNLGTNLETDLGTNLGTNLRTDLRTGLNINLKTSSDINILDV